jgi:hypothetical protein
MHVYRRYDAAAGKHGLRGLLARVNGPQFEEAVFMLLDVANQLWRRVVSPESRAALVENTRRALAMAELYLPTHMLDLKLHNWLHLAEQVLASAMRSGRP